MIRNRVIAFIALSFVSLSFVHITPSFAANTNNFTITDYQIDYYLSRTENNRSSLKTVETITADFTQPNQNHGIERAIPTTYDGHKTQVAVTDVTNAEGARLNYVIRQDNGNDVVRIGETDQYVLGRQTYKITYQQQDVTKYFADTGRDEFYWDTNGTDWAVPITNLQVRLHLDQSIRMAVTNNQQCYVGARGSTTSCPITPTDDGFSLQAANLAAGQNVSIAIGFDNGTFAAYTPSLGERLLQIWSFALFATALLAIVIVVWLSIRYDRRSNRTSELSTIIPEYTPPKQTSVSTSASIIRNTTTVFSAQLIDLAVRGYLKIYQTAEKSTWKPAKYDLEVVKDPVDLLDEEQELLRDIFGTPGVGSRLPMESLKNNAAFRTNLSDNEGKIKAAISGAYGLRAANPVESAWFVRCGWILLVLAVASLSPWLLIAAITSFVMARTLKPLTDKGLVLRRYLEGLKLYIKTAEADRIKMLQGPDTAEKIGAPVDTNDSRQLIKLYEKALPYAIIFGQEKDWNKQLGAYYETAQKSPDWYAGNSAVFNAVVLSSAISNFNTAATYNNPSSSAAGGSGGGGFSGGGGGGGGGGGW